MSVTMTLQLTIAVKSRQILFDREAFWGLKVQQSTPSLSSAMNSIPFGYSFGNMNLELGSQPFTSSSLACWTCKAYAQEIYRSTSPSLVNSPYCSPLLQFITWPLWRRELFLVQVYTIPYLKTTQYISLKLVKSIALFRLLSCSNSQIILVELALSCWNLTAELRCVCRLRGLTRHRLEYLQVWSDEIYLTLNCGRVKPGKTSRSVFQSNWIFMSMSGVMGTLTCLD